MTDMMKLVDGVLLPTTPDDIVAFEALQNSPDVIRAQVTGQYNSLINAGCELVFSQMPILTATYAITPDMVSRVTAVAAGLAVGKGFPHGEANLSWPDIEGTFRQFGPTDWLTLAAALEGYVADLDAWEALAFTGTSAPLPAQPITV